MKFLDVKTDFAFKKVFGSEESKGLLIHFLNAMLYQEAAHQINDLTIVQPYSVPQLKGLKDSYVDVKARLDNGSQVIIEMQVLNYKGFEQRILYNTAKSFAAQLRSGDDYSLLNPVIALTIVNFEMFAAHELIATNTKSPPYLSRFRLLEQQTLVEYSDDIELVFIELPKFDKPESDLANTQEKWIYFIKNAGRLDVIPESLAQPEEINKAFQLVNEANMTADELEVQDKRREFIMMQRSAIESANAQGLAQGREEGLEQGAREKALAIASNLLDVLDDHTIAGKTGLSMATVKALRE
jgi:predicted transposase/invertase (TIGR01784 family)